MSLSGRMTSRRTSSTKHKTSILAETLKQKFHVDTGERNNGHANCANATPLINKLERYSDEELQEYKQVFDMFDTDRSGAIGLGELEIAMQNLGLDPKPEDLERIINEVDQIGNHEIDFDEFCEVMNKLNQKQNGWNQVVRECFEVFDRKKNGHITKEEFEATLRELGDFTNSSVIDEIFADVDVDANGIIDYDEFSFMVKNYLLDEDVF
ncbi:hypothetical protein QR680_003911 [Steinernema hermaphroditum]|uniref:EF-hand domain-containing protein n=1 Tax=Steinernema hermaphroditum TaxID=289476 RepID=A0AA39HM21_9BILA|nr:hypothetical protein QR680_003911 [Steinernema hermaphroditum]